MGNCISKIEGYNIMDAHARTGMCYYIAPTGTAGNGTSGQYLSSKWEAASVDGITTPYDGMRLAVRIPVQGVSTAGVTLSIDGGTTWHSVRYNRNTALTTHYAQYAMVYMVYDANESTNMYLTSNTATTVQGTWKCTADYDSTNIYQLRHQSGTYVAYADITRYKLLLQNSDTQLMPISSGNSTSGHTYDTTTEFNPFGVIAYLNNSTNTGNKAVAQGTAITANQLYQQIAFDLRYTFNGVTSSASTSSIVANKDVYLVATPQSSGFAKLDSNPLTQTLPGTDDGKIYIYLGHSYSVYQMELHPIHPIYWYKGGKICPYTGLENTNTTYTFADGTNSFTVTPSGGTAQTVNVTPSITDNALTTTSISGTVTGSTSTSAGTVGGTVGSPSVTVTKKTVTDALGYTPPTSDTLVNQAAANDNNYYPILFSETKTSSITDGAHSSKYKTDFTFNPLGSYMRIGSNAANGNLVGIQPSQISVESNDSSSNILNQVLIAPNLIKCQNFNNSKSISIEPDKIKISSLISASYLGTDSTGKIISVSAPASPTFTSLTLSTTAQNFASLNGTNYTLQLPSTNPWTDSDTHVNVTGDTSTTKYLLGTSVTPSSTVQNVESTSDTAIKVNETIRSIGYKLNVDANYAMICGMGFAKSANIGTSDTNTNMNMWVRAMGSNPIIGFRCSGSSQIWYFQATSTYLYLGPTSSSALWMSPNGDAGESRSLWGGFTTTEFGNSSLKGQTGIIGKNIWDTGLTASKLVATDANKKLVSYDLTSSNITTALGTQTANTVLAGPTSGSAANPTFRALTMADLPSSVDEKVVITGSIQEITQGQNLDITFTGDYAQMTIDDIIDDVIVPAYTAKKRIIFRLTEIASNSSFDLQYIGEINFFVNYHLFNLTGDIGFTGMSISVMIIHSAPPDVPSSTAVAIVNQIQIPTEFNDIVLSTTAQTYVDTTQGGARTIQLPASNPWGVSVSTLTTSALTVSNGTYYTKDINSNSTITLTHSSKSGDMCYLLIHNTLTGSDLTISLSGSGFIGGGTYSVSPNGYMEFSILTTVASTTSVITFTEIYNE